MRLVLRLTLAVLLTLLGVGATVATAGTACACSCRPLTVDEVTEGAGAVVVGRAVAQREQGGSRIYEFEVDASYKTAVPERIEIATSLVSASCGVELEIGRTRTLVLGYGAPIGDPEPSTAGWTAALCSNISGLGTGPMPASAGPRLEPLPATASPTAAETSDDGDAPLWLVTLVVLVGVAVVGGGVVLAARQSRR